MHRFILRNVSAAGLLLVTAVFFLSGQPFVKPLLAQAPGSYAIEFNGETDYVASPEFSPITNNFTMEAWVYPTATHEIDIQSRSGYAGCSGQRYAVYPSHGTYSYGPDESAAGISVGTNGVSVYEHCGYYMPALLVYEAPIIGWTHIAVVYRNRRPSLYVNGHWVKTGLRGWIPKVHPSAGENHFAWRNMGGIGGGYYGYFQGRMSEFRIWDTVLSKAQIQSTMSGRLLGTEQHLAIYFDMDRRGAGEGLTVQNKVIPADTASTGMTFGTADTPIFIHDEMLARAVAASGATDATAESGPDPEGESSMASLDGTDVPANAIALGQNFPNPVSGWTVIPYQLRSPSAVTLELCDANGRVLRTLLNESESDGEYQQLFDSSTLDCEGEYFIRLTVGSESRSVQLIHVR